MKETEGNLIDMALEGKFEVIIHGCNCFNTMGSGLAGQIKRRLPEAYAADQETVKGDMTKLGIYSSAEFSHGGHLFTVVNAYTQYSFGIDKRHTDYDAIREVMRIIKQHFAGERIGYPLIGAFRGGGDWKIISGIIDQELAGEDHTLVRFKNV